MSGLDVTIIPAGSDNYIYLLRDEQSDAVGVVDPGVHEPVLEVLGQRGLKLTHILLTHHHGDHIAGMGALTQAFQPEVLGPAADQHRIAGITQPLSEGVPAQFGSLVMEVYETPGHTSGHISLYFPEAGCLFSGDTLFSLGCGRLFEGSAAQMWGSLLKLRGLPDETLVYCGHEYTAANARFALSLDRANTALIERAAEVTALREAGQPSLPVALGVEKAANPFLRADDATLAKATGLEGAPAAEVFAEIRRRKDAA